MAIAESPRSRSQTSLLRADRDRFVALAFCWADVLIELDRELRIAFAAGLTMAITRLGPEALTGRHVDDVLTPGHRAEIRRLLRMAETCGRVDNVSIRFLGPDGDGVAVDLAIHKLPDLGDQSFLAMRLRDQPAADRPPAASDRGLLDAETFVAVARRGLVDGHRTAGPALTLISLPGIATLRRSLDDAVFRNLTNTIAGYLTARSVGRNTAAIIADGRYALLHDAGLDVERLESQLLSMVDGSDPSGAGNTVQSASIRGDASLSDAAMGQVAAHAVRQFREADEIGETLRRLRDELPKVAVEAAEMAATFARLVDSRGFHIAFQPVLSCDDGGLLFYEGLARVDGQDEASPHRYICYAEETGQIREFDLAMAEKALAWVNGTPGLEAGVSINVSGLSMLDPEFITRLHRLLDGHPGCGPRLAFEITDAPRIPDLGAADVLVQSLRKRGHRVGLDDFASDVDGFRILSAITVDFVKFVPGTAGGAGDDRKSRALLSSLTGYCRSLGIRTVATAVETRDALGRLRACGIECAQGFLFGKPSPDIDGFRVVQADVRDRAGATG